MSPDRALLVRVLVFALVFAVMALWELREPWRAMPPNRRRVWGPHLTLAALGILVSRLALPLGAVGAALFAESRGWGLLRAAPMPGWIAFVLALLALDLAIYAQHIAFHLVPWLWRLHRVHHADEHLDASTGVRFHPVEILVSLGWKAVVVLALGPSALAVFLFEVLLNASSLFSHTNAGLPRRLEPVLRWVVVTPEMHRVHHSVARVETDSNFGFNLSWWDRLFGTYRAEAAAGEGLRFGVVGLPAGRTTSLPWMLALPFRSPRRGARRDEGGFVRAIQPSIGSVGASMEAPIGEATTAGVDREELRSAIRDEYAQVAADPAQGFHFHTGRRLADLLGYREQWLATVPDDALASFAGTGNPFLGGELASGERVVDVGCGAGLDTLIAAAQVGPGGRVVGVDMTPAMLERARAAAGAAGYGHVELRQGYGEELPVPDAWADVVISNGVLNLMPDKPAALAEMARVLRPGGRLQVGDLLVERPVPESARRKIDLWTG